MQGTKALRGMYAFTVIGATTLVAYFQALGANKLVEASLTVPLLQPPPTPAPPATPQHDPAPLPPLPLVPELPPADRPKLVLAGAPACAGLELKIASQAADPLASRATVRHTGGPSGSLLHQGSVFDDMHLLHVGYDGVGVTPVAWFLRGESVCQLRMFSRSGAPTPPTEHATVPTEQTQRDEITPLGPNSFQVDRELVDRLLAAPGATRDAYAGFERGPSGTFALKFQRVRPGGWAHALGLRVGDRLTSVNGYELKDPRHAIEAYAALRMTNDLTLKIERGGRSKTIQVAIR